MGDGVLQRKNGPLDRASGLEKCSSQFPKDNSVGRKMAPYQPGRKHKEGDRQRAHYVHLPRGWWVVLYSDRMWD